MIRRGAHTAFRRPALAGFVFLSLACMLGQVVSWRTVDMGASFALSVVGCVFLLIWAIRRAREPMPIRPTQSDAVATGAQQRAPTQTGAWRSGPTHAWVPGASRPAQEPSRVNAQRAYMARVRRIEDMRALEPVAFERFVADLFRRMGYTVETTAVTGDNGIDLMMQKGGRRAIVQCKRYRGTVGEPVVRDLFGAMVHEMADEAFLVTTGTITLPAQAWAQGKPIHLVDGVQLEKWREAFDAELSPPAEHSQ